MSRTRQLVFCFTAVAVFTLFAQTPPPAPLKNPAAALMPPVPPPAVSPVTFFRELLAMSATERNQSLTNRSPETRARIMAKVREYLALNPDDRELRLRATELRWHLAPLFRSAPADRSARLAQLPDELRESVNARLAQWDLLPPNVKQEFLDNDKTLHYFSSGGTTNAVSAEQQKLSEQFNQFFELTAEEKELALGTLSDAERAAMEKTLQTFEKLPASQRTQCVRNYAKFAGMNAAERVEFLKNAEHWSQMSPKERQSWRDLVAHVPMMPPLPAPIVPQNLMPPTLAKQPRASMATN